ncbi:hypothetical protein JCM14076_19890 [Methylosoma difficile]
MRNILINLTAAVLAASSLSVFAQPIDKASIPENVMEAFYKRHPNAVDLVAEPKNHYKQDLYLLEFKDGEDRLMEYFRTNGRFFVAGVVVGSPKTSDILPLNSAASLNAAFGKYEFKKAIMMINPNGVGEEFDFVITNASGDWDVTMDRKGNITSKQQR